MAVMEMPRTAIVEKRIAYRAIRSLEGRDDSELIFFRKGLNELVNVDDGDESARSECEEFSIFKHTHKNP
jgi:hypothetical protein